MPEQKYPNWKFDSFRLSNPAKWASPQLNFFVRALKNLVFLYLIFLWAYLDIFSLVELPLLVGTFRICSKVEVNLADILLNTISTSCFFSFLIFVLYKSTWVWYCGFFFVKVQQTAIIHFSAIWSWFHCNCETKRISFFFFWFVRLSRTSQWCTKDSSFGLFVWIRLKILYF